MSVPATPSCPFDVGTLGLIKAGVSVGLLSAFWCWETLNPFFAGRTGRRPHAARNLSIAVLNALAMGQTFGVAIVCLAGWAGREGVGLLHQFDLTWPARLLAALVLLDGWMYLWHRLNHAVPLLWRFHRMHH